MADTLRTLDQRIASAMAALHGARAAATRSPNASNLLLAEIAELALNELLDGRPRQSSAKS